MMNMKLILGIALIGWIGQALSLVDQEGLLVKGHIIGKVLVTPYYEITFEIKPLGELPDIGSILHLTTGKDNGEFGARTPSVWFESGGSRLTVCSGIGKEYNSCYTAEYNIPFYQFNNITIRQIPKEGHLFFQVLLGNKIWYEIKNNHPRTYKNVIVYSSNPWHKPAIAMVKNFNFKNLQYPTLSHPNLLETIKLLTPFYEITFEINPIVKIHGLGSIIHFTTGGDNGVHGYRTPAIWFSDKSSKLYVCTTIGKKHDHCEVSSYEIPFYKYSTIKITQHAFHKKIFFIVYIEDQEIFKVHNPAPRFFSDVQVYSPDKWYNPAQAVVRNYKFVNLNEPRDYFNSIHNKIIALETTHQKFLKSHPHGQITIDHKPTMFRIKAVNEKLLHRLEVYLFTAYRTYVTVDEHGIISAKKDIQWAEKFYIIFVDKLHVAFISSSGKYLTTEHGGELKATAHYIGEHELFKIHIH